MDGNKKCERSKKPQNFQAAGKPGIIEVLGYDKRKLGTVHLQRESSAQKERKVAIARLQCAMCNAHEGGVRDGEPVCLCAQAYGSGRVGSVGFIFGGFVHDQYMGGGR